MRDQAAAASARPNGSKPRCWAWNWKSSKPKRRSARTTPAVGQNRERIAAYEATIDHERRLSADLEQEVARYRRQLTAMSLRAGNLDDQLRETVRALAAAEEEHRERVAPPGRPRADADRTDTPSWTSCRSENEQRPGRASRAAAGRLGAGQPDQRARIAKVAAQAVCQRGDARRAELKAALGRTGEPN